MSEVRWIRSLDGEAFGHERLVEQLAAEKHVGEETVETIATFDIELDADAPTLQTSLCEQRGFLSEALGRLVRMIDLGSVQADQPEALRPPVEEDVDRVAVDHSSNRNAALRSLVSELGLLILPAAGGAQDDGGESNRGGSLHGGQPMAP